MIGTGAALIGAALIGGGASIYGANKASKQQEKAGNQALAFQQQVYGENKNNLAPWMESGKGANNLLESFYGLNGTGPALGDSALARFKESPDYKFALSEGMAGLENSAAAKGGLLGGNQIRRTVEFGQGLASNNLQNYLTRISGMSQQGLSAAGALAGNGATMSGQIGGTMGNIGQAQASGTVGMANGVNSAMNNLLMYNQLGKSSYGNGSSFAPSTVSRDNLSMWA
jgi:hypothetical protein